MVIVNELGRLLLEQGWSESEIIDLGYGAEEKEGDENEYYDEASTLFASTTPEEITSTRLEEITSTTPEVTESTSYEMFSSTIPDDEVFTQEINLSENNLSIFTEMSTEGMSEIVADMLISENSSTTLWESVTSSGQQVADFISEKLILRQVIPQRETQSSTVRSTARKATSQVVKTIPLYRRLEPFL